MNSDSKPQDQPTRTPQSPEPESQAYEPSSPESYTPLIAPRAPRQAPPPRGDDDDSISALFIVERVLIPGFIGMVGSVILGIGLPSAIDSLGMRHTLAAMGRQAAQRIHTEFNALANMDFSGNFPLMLLFGFLLGVFIRHAYGSDQVR